MLGRPRQYGDIDDSQEVHDEIREVGKLVTSSIASRKHAGFNGEQGVLEGLRKHGAAPGGQKMMNAEMAAALWSIEQGTYVTWRSNRTGEDCCRVGPATLCICGHAMSEHDLSTRKVKCVTCRCPFYRYIPSRPEEIGFGHLTRRKEFDITKWSPKCRCKHGSKEHRPKCTDCGCPSYQSDWACLVCDAKWEDHETVFEDEAERRMNGKPVGEAYKPLAGLDQEFSNIVFGKKNAQGVHVLPAPKTYNPPSQARAQARLASRSSACGSCGTPFASSAAKFCTECGQKR
eukprot:TRINITY_DN13201_c0_g1_i1.p1 TRINITY_DN13201_c0_g1~~TRINITY_DN13201_c0_g1_i1.p1  ORF type:complete len:288 (+),score=65.50 TRINITY_DN13201_c0_g1_i1:24-887(+)